MGARYSTLDPAEVVRTLGRLEARIESRFPGAGLARVAAEARGLAAETAERVRAIERPDRRLRVLAGGLIAAGVAGLGFVGAQMDYRAETTNLFGLVQSIDALVNLTLLSGAAVFSLVTVERRVRRDRAIAALAPFRALVHVVDMHQLTKDPGMVGPGATTTDASPERTMTAFELTRYLDYCSELLSLVAKAAALYALATGDGAVATAVNEIEQLTANLSQKIWQKIMILHRDGAPGPAPAAGPPVPPGD